MVLETLHGFTHEIKSSVLYQSGNALLLSLESDIKSCVKFILKHAACEWES